jgi:hypothetical protein
MFWSEAAGGIVANFAQLLATLRRAVSGDFKRDEMQV